ncbi:MAG: hypothetical protein JJ899_06485 [Alphaproteobacteria bacterium]|nr:hypothetical protein [Alphaproteobacteria bacterium]
MERYPSIWQRVMTLFGAQRTHQRPDDEPDKPDTEEILERMEDDEQVEPARSAN